MSQTTGETEEMVVNRCKEGFFTNLHYITKLEVENQGLRDVDDINQRIKSVENMLFKQIEMINDNVKNFENKNENSFTNTNKKDKCSHFHITKTHSLDECNALRRKNRKESNQKINHTKKKIT